MNRHFAMFALLALGCSQAPQLASQPLSEDAMLTTLPANTTLIGGVSPAAFLQHDDWLELALPQHEHTRRQLNARTGLRDLHAAEELRLGCGATGCVVLATGDFRELRTERLRRSSPPALRTRAHPRGFDVHTHDGTFVVRRLSPRKLIAGDRRAVVHIARQQHRARQNNAPATLDLTPLEGLVPPGDLWLAAHSPAELSQHIGQRLRRSHDPSAHQLARQIDSFVREQHVVLDAVEAVALSIRAGTLADVVLRVRCSTEQQARVLAALAKSRRVLLPASLPPSLRGSIHVSQHGDIVQLSATFDWTELAVAHHGQSAEVQP